MIEVWTKVTAKVGDKSFDGEFNVDGGVLTVRSTYGTKHTHVGRSPPDVTARIMLSEMVRHGRGD